MRVSFTGTRKGMDEAQNRAIMEFFDVFGAKISLFVHGGCIGADNEAHAIARKICGPKLYIACLPSTIDATRRVPPDCQFVADPAPPRERDKHIVRIGNDLLLAAPLQRTEVIGSGSWTTVRFARRIGVGVEVYLRKC